MRVSIFAFLLCQLSFVSWASCAMFTKGMLRKSVSVGISVCMFSSAPAFTSATPLGEHTTCAYPACTSATDIIKNNAPSLTPQAEINDLVRSIKDTQFVIQQYPSLLESKDFPAIRQSLRSYPAGTLRINLRKVRVYVNEDSQDLFQKVVSAVKDGIDDIDSYARLQEEAKLKETIQRTSNEFENLIGIIGPLEKAL